MNFAKKELAAGKDPNDVLDMLTKSLTKKLIHDPTVLLRNAEGLTDAEREHMTYVVGHFFEHRER